MVPPMPPNPTMRRARDRSLTGETGQKADIEFAMSGAVCLKREEQESRDHLTQIAASQRVFS